MQDQVIARQYSVLDISIFAVPQNIITAIATEVIKNQPDGLRCCFSSMLFAPRQTESVKSSRPIGYVFIAYEAASYLITQILTFIAHAI